jgi:hypothetical protein
VRNISKRVHTADPGDVRVSDRSSVWFGAVLGGDASWIEIGAESSIQDNAVVHRAGLFACGRGLTCASMAHSLDLTLPGARVTEVTAVRLAQNDTLVGRDDPGYEDHR